MSIPDDIHPLPTLTHTPPPGLSCTSEGGLVLHLPENGLGMGSDALALMAGFMDMLQEKMERIRETLARQQSFDALRMMEGLFEESTDIDTITFLSSVGYEDDGTMRLTDIRVDHITMKEGRRVPDGLEHHLSTATAHAMKGFEYCRTLIGVVEISGVRRNGDWREKTLSRETLPQEFKKAHDSAFGWGDSSVWDEDMAHMARRDLDQSLPQRQTSRGPGRI